MKPLAGRRILVSNDDGIHAPGLKALEEVARSLSDDVWTVAPATEQSAMSHSLTTRRPLYTRNFGERRVAVDGTPTDCVVVAINKILADKRPDLVLGGINHGANLGEDVIYSGTVAVAMEAALFGLRAVAFSQLRPPSGPISFEAACSVIPDILQRLDRFSWAQDQLINVNFPPGEITGFEVCRQGRRDTLAGVIEGTDPGGRPYVWLGDWGEDSTLERDSDLAAIQKGCVTITPLKLDFTDHQSLDRLREAIE